jgi:hypothetical protein
MNWSKIKHKRKFKRYIRAISLNTTDDEIKRKLTALLSDRKIDVEFYVTQLQKKYYFGVFAVINEESIYLLHRFQIYDFIEKKKRSGDDYFSTFVSFTDLYRGGEFLEKLPEPLEVFHRPGK